MVGDPAVWIRTPALLGGILTIPLTYALGVRTLGNRGAPYFAATLAASARSCSGTASRRAPTAWSSGLSSPRRLRCCSQSRRDERGGGLPMPACPARRCGRHYTAAFVPSLSSRGARTSIRRLDARRSSPTRGCGLLSSLAPSGLIDDLESPTQDVYELLTPFGFDNFIDFTVRLAVAIQGSACTTSWERGRGRAVMRSRAGDRRSIAFLVFGHGTASMATRPVGGLGPPRDGRAGRPRRRRAPQPGRQRPVRASQPGRVLAGARRSRWRDRCQAGCHSRGGHILVVEASAYGAIESLTDPVLKRPPYRDAAALVDEEIGPTGRRPRRKSAFHRGHEGLPAFSPALTLDLQLDEPQVNIHYIKPPDGRRASGAASGHKLTLVGNLLSVDRSVSPRPGRDNARRRAELRSASCNRADIRHRSAGAVATRRWPRFLGSLDRSRSGRVRHTRLPHRPA